MEIRPEKVSDIINKKYDDLGSKIDKAIEYEKGICSLPVKPIITDTNLKKHQNIIIHALSAVNH